MVEVPEHPDFSQNALGVLEVFERSLDLRWIRRGPKRGCAKH
jgi:hypothetical protein